MDKKNGEITDKLRVLLSRFIYKTNDSVVPVGSEMARNPCPPFFLFNCARVPYYYPI